jgi:hypothetical protein
MRWLLPVLLMLGACEDQRSFDDRYADTEAQLENKARSLDERLAHTNSGSTGTTPR